MRINESTAKLIAMNFFQRNNHGVIITSAVLKGNSWLVSVNILSPKKQVKVLVNAESGEISGYHKLDQNQPNPRN